MIWAMHSMTGFGRGTHSTEEWTAEIEVASINRKQLEIVANLPRHLQSLESRVRHTILPHVSRGRIQVSLKLEKAEGSGGDQVRVNPALAKSFEAAFTQLSDVIGRSLHPAAADFLRQPGIIETRDLDEIDPEVAWQAIAPALAQAISKLNEMRASEGSHLHADFQRRIARLLTYTATISDHAPSRPERQRDLLFKRLSDLEISLELDDERLLKELAVFADRCDISEEITRLESHFSKFEDYMNSTEPAGRPLDFLCQELFREFNTIGSKANDALIAQNVVEAKTELEKIREQVQNIE